MRVFIQIVSFFVLVQTGYSQTVTFTDGGSVTIPCGDPITFDDGYGDPYPANTSDTMTICSDGVNGLSIALVLANEVGGIWDVDQSDTLYVFDGPDVNSPLIGAFNNGNLQFGTLSVTTSLDNLSGCITLLFVTDGSNNAGSFSGTVGCYFQCQPIEPSVGSSPSLSADTTIDVCLGDTVWLNAEAAFPLSSSNNGPGYNQTLDNSQIDWVIAGGGEFSGVSGYFVPDQTAGYYVNLQITDSLGCFEFAQAKVRVSTTPVYAEMAESLDDTICEGETAIILGGIDALLSDTVGVEPTPSEYIIGGLFADQLELPDGATGTLEDIYSTTISINGAAPDDTISQGSDIVNICIEMEHSWLTDLEMWLTCPSGDTVVLFDAYDASFGANLPGYIPGGFPASSGINLGVPGGINVGDCWSYCFSLTENTFGTMESEYQGMTTQMTAGTYLPETSYDNLIGCPVNGNWTLNVADNWGGDDGWICQWNIQLNENLTPEPEYYSPRLVNAYWTPDPTLEELGDTAIAVTPITVGNHSYTFNVEDNFGCTHDTTVTVTVLPGPALSAPTENCVGTAAELTVSNSNEGGTWSYTGPDGVVFTPNNEDETPEVDAPTESYYTFLFFDDYCQTEDSITVLFADEPDVSIFADTNRVCDALELTISATPGTEFFTGGTPITWSPSGLTQNELTVSAADQSNYFFIDPSDSTLVSVTATASNYCGTSSQDFPFEIIDCEVITPSVFNPNSGIADNAYFNIPGLALHVGNNLKVFDRWGRKVYDVDNYHLAPWNGGKNSDGVYYYVLTRPGYEAETGFVHLVHSSGQ